MDIRSLIAKTAITAILALPISAFAANFVIDESVDGELNGPNLKSTHHDLNLGDTLTVHANIAANKDFFDFTIADGAQGKVELTNLFQSLVVTPGVDRNIGISLREGLNNLGPKKGGTATIFRHDDISISDLASGPLTLFDGLLGAGDYTVTIRGMGGANGAGIAGYSLQVSAVPLPAAFWLFGSAFMGMLGLRRAKRS